MFFGEDQNTPEVDDILPVQTKFRAGRAARRRQSDQFREVAAPGKVFAPGIVARVKERNFLQCNRVKTSRFDVLVIIAALAGARQIVLFTAASEDFGNDVFG